MKNILIISENGSLKAELENTGFFGDVKTSVSFSGNKLNKIDILIVDGLTISYDQYLKNILNVVEKVKSNYYISKDLDAYSTINKNLSGHGIIVIPPLLTDTQITQKICSLVVDDFTVKNNIVCFFGAGPEVGTTMISQSLSQVLADVTGKSINYLVLNGSMGSNYFNISSIGYGLAEIKDRLINNILSCEELKNSCLKINSLYILPGDNDISKVRHYHPEYIEKLINLSSKTFDITIINSGSTITGMSIGALNSSKLKYLITTQSYKHFRNFEKLLNQVFINLGISPDDFSLVINKYIESGELEDEISLSKNYGMPLASVIPLLDYVTGLEAENKEKTLVDYDSMFESSIMQLSVLLCKDLGIEIKNKKVKKSSFLKRIMRKG